MPIKGESAGRARVRHRRATIVDVAAVAGVSRQTVSRVITGGDLVAESTHALVTSAIQELGYRPNHFARTLAQQRSCILGVAARDLNSPLTPPFIARLQALCRPLGYHVIVSNFDLDDRGGIGTLDTFVTLNVDGIALFPSAMDTAAIEQFACSYDGRLVAIGRTERFEGVHSLSLDEDAAARLVVDHLRTTGREKIAILADEWYPDTPHPRTNALESALMEVGCPAVCVIGGHVPTIDGGVGAMTELVSAVSADGVDAVIAFNDTMAIGALDACRRLCLSVPEHVALVGYDNLDYGVVTSPPLTTVPQNAEHYAEIVFELLVSEQAWSDDGTAPLPALTLVAPTLEIRGSS